MRAFLVASAATLVAADNLADRFDEFKSKFDKSYTDSSEELRRFKIFTRNMEIAEKQASMDSGSASYGHLSPMADLSEEEFRLLNNLPVSRFGHD